MRNIILLIHLLLLGVSCIHDDRMGQPEPAALDALSFQINTSGYSEESLARSTSTELFFDRIESYVLDDNGFVITNVRSLYDAKLSQIRLEGLLDGDYEILLLALRGDYHSDGAVIHKLKEADDAWMTFPANQDGQPLHAEYFHVRHPFTIENGKIIENQINLKRMIGKVKFSFNYHNDYVRNTVKNIEIQPRGTALFPTGFTGKGVATGEGQALTNLSLSDHGYYLLLPDPKGSTLNGRVVVQTQRHSGEKIDRAYSFEVTIRPNHSSDVVIDVIHPDDNTGLLYIPKSGYSTDNLSFILADDEPLDVLYSNQRQFIVNEPLQISMVENQLQFRFYSPLPISGVTVYGKLPNSADYLEIAHLDSVPSFSNIIHDFPMLREERIYRTEKGKYVYIPIQSKEAVQAMTYKIVSQDTYWQKIAQIRARWRISFRGANGNWLEMRPVHAREAISLMTNMAYMITMPGYLSLLKSFQGSVLDNDSKTPVDMASIPKKMEERPAFSMGVVKPELGGLGGGNALGLRVSSFLNHYYGGLEGYVIFHEFAHCLGYSHASGMTVGEHYPWKSGKFYADNLSKFPVYSAAILNSKQNPNI